MTLPQDPVALKRLKMRAKYFLYGKGKGNPIPTDVQEWIDSRKVAPEGAVKETPVAGSTPSGSPTAHASGAAPPALDPKILAMRETLAKALPSAPFNIMAAMRTKQFGPGEGDFWKLNPPEENFLGEAAKVAMDLFMKDTDPRWIALGGGILVGVMAFAPRYMTDQSRFGARIRAKKAAQAKIKEEAKVTPAPEVPKDGERDPAGSGPQGERQDLLGQTEQGPGEATPDPGHLPGV